MIGSLHAAAHAIRAQLQLLRTFATHPITRRAPAAAVRRWISWQVGARLLPGEAVIPFVEPAVLVLRPGMTGATGNVYFGLHDFEDMSFVLHLLRANDLLADVGANVGSYSVLAARVRGARVAAFEPSSLTVATLRRNVAVNDIGELVTVHAKGVGSEPGTVRFTRNLDTVNHVASSTSLEGDNVEVVTLDSALRCSPPTLVKIDVEGYELRVLQGATAVLTAPSLLALIVELNGSGARYGLADTSIVALLGDFGFFPCTYDPLRRRLARAEHANSRGNTIFVRDHQLVQRRLADAPKFSVCGIQL